MACQRWTWMVVALLLWSGVLTTAKFNPHVPRLLDSEWKNMDDIEKLLASAVYLPLHSQKMLLKEVGKVFEKVSEGHCNIFGGHSSCVPIPTDSDYAKLCTEANKKVDCAFELAALEHISKDPETHFQEKLAKEGFTDCPECYKNMHQFWCAQTVPTCGTFEKVIDEILPLLTAVAQKKEKASVALQQTVPRMLQAASLGLPCKQMCHAITETCGCGKAANFGEVMVSLQSGKHRDMYSTNMSLSTAKDIFQKVWDKPVCDLFADKDLPGFAGVCHVPESANHCSWCKGNTGPQFVHEQIVAQIAQSVSGLMQGGLEEILVAAGGEKAKGGSGWSWTQNGESGGKKSGGHSGVWTILILLMFIATGAFFAAVRIHRNRQNPSQYVDLNSMGYTPPIL